MIFWNDAFVFFTILMSSDKIIENKSEKSRKREQNPSKDYWVFIKSMNAKSKDYLKIRF